MLTEVVLLITDECSGPRLTVALGTTEVVPAAPSVTAVAPMPSPTVPRPRATFAHAVRVFWTPCCASRASTCLSISELILSTSPSATAPSYAPPSSVCTAAAAATSWCARSST